MLNDLMTACAFYLVISFLVFLGRLYWWVYYSPEESNMDHLSAAMFWPIFFVCMIVDYASNILNKKREDRIEKQKAIERRS